jgi:hypothetical protein
MKGFLIHPGMVMVCISPAYTHGHLGGHTGHTLHKRRARGHLGEAKRLPHCGNGGDTTITAVL